MAKVSKRRTIRMPGWDYSSTGIYMVTICADASVTAFGNVKNGRTHLSNIGSIAQENWEAITSHTQCGMSFEITRSDLAFYEKVSPTFSGKM